MNGIRKYERDMYICPEVDCNDIHEYPLVNSLLKAIMEEDYRDETDSVHVFAFFSRNRNGEPYIDVYFWDVMLYPYEYKRFVICEGKRMSENDEEEFLEYIEYIKMHKIRMMKSIFYILRKNIQRTYPSWNYSYNEADYTYAALAHMYFASHRCGVREILFKANLGFIAANIDEIARYSLITRTSMCPNPHINPKLILGEDIPAKLIRTLNNPFLVHYLYSEDMIDESIRIYKKYSNYMDKNVPSGAQWEYLRNLYFNIGCIGKKGFNMSIYRRLEFGQDEELIRLYERFIELRTVLSLDMKIPSSASIGIVVSEMEKVYKYTVNPDDEINQMVIDRSKDKNLEYSDDKFVITMPKDAVEFCMEGILQGNCLTSYLNAHASGKTTIMYIRLIDKPDAPFVDIEIGKSSINQIYGAYNELPKREVYEFVEKFARSKGLAYKPEHLIMDNIYDYDDTDNEELMEYISKYYAGNECA